MYKIRRKKIVELPEVSKRRFKSGSSMNPTWSNSSVGGSLLSPEVNLRAFRREFKLFGLAEMPP
jgi:hypothetical protein